MGGEGREMDKRKGVGRGGEGRRGEERILIKHIHVQQLTFKGRHRSLEGTGSCHVLDLIEIRDKEVVTDVLEAINAGRNTH